MTPYQNDLILRPITGPDELDLFNRLPYALNSEIRGDLAAGRRRPEWIWMALRGERPTELVNPEVWERRRELRIEN